MRINLAGRVAKVHLEKYQPLLPLIEAVINSLHAIEDSKVTAPMIQIAAHHERGMKLGDEADRLAPIDSFTIEDNGIGFTDENQQSFETSDSAYKRDRGGKGIGRLLWLRAFDRAEIESTYGYGRMMKRMFTFALPDGVDSVPATPTDATERKTTVRLIGFKDPWRDTAPRHLDKIGITIIEQCFLFFLRSNRPPIALSDGFETIDLNQEFDSRFLGTARTHEFAFKGHKFRLSCFRMRSNFGKHELVFTADSREVLVYALGKVLPNLQASLVAEDGVPFWYFAVLQADYLDSNVNPERTSFSIPARREDSDLYPDPTLVELRDYCAQLVATDLAPFTAQLEEVKSQRLENYVCSVQPKYRPFLSRYRQEALAELAPNSSDREMDDVLHRLKSRKEEQTRKEARECLDASTSSDSEEHAAKVRELLSRIGDFELSALAEYVVHRRLVLDLFAQALEKRGNSHAYSLESVVHDLVFPMRTTSEDSAYNKQNLWIIDERLTFHSFLASDKSLKSINVLENDSASRPDILIFDRPFVFGDVDLPLTSILIIEFKRPLRESYDEDPVTQVYRLVREIREGKLKDSQGRLLRPASNQIPAYCYVIADLTEPLEIRLQNMGATRTPDNMGYYGFNPTLSAYYEVISYSKVLSDARKRNRVLFDKLGLP
ncbi:MAG TPA: ATP-binding protein [Steroidobacteraceae bacterium]|jgi:hypothetical protein|nr:ATP-binding protein [Steroidobacteraceae bacterium]